MTVIVKTVHCYIHQRAHTAILPYIEKRPMLVN